MRKICTSLIESKHVGNVLVLDEDAVFHCNLKERLMALLKVARCGNYVHAGLQAGRKTNVTKKGGALMLGGAVSPAA